MWYLRRTTLFLLFFNFFKHKKRAARTTVGSALRAHVAASPFPSVVLFLWFSSSHPTGCGNVATERFKNSILHSDSAALVAPHYCAASSRNVKMATDLGELLVPYMPTIRVPRTGDRVFKSECAFSFDSPVSGRLPPPHTPPHTNTRSACCRWTHVSLPFLSPLPGNFSFFWGGE